MLEDFADNAFVYATVQLMKIGEREDGWHTDGGASLLHAAVTVFWKPHVAGKARRWRRDQLTAAAWFFLRREPLRLEPYCGTW